MLALDKSEDLTTNLMEKICDKTNLNQAYKQVKANKGCAGIDKMPVSKLLAYLKSNGEEIISQVLAGTYRPLPVMGIDIPKPGGGSRKLGVPAVIDRWLQQAIHQVLSPMFEQEFSNSSFGFRPDRGAHDALRHSQGYVLDGKVWCVDIDLEKFFDTVCQDRLMSKLAAKISDKRLLKLIRKFLQAGIMQNGIFAAREIGVSQGSPLSPLLSNVVLDELDKELERRGHSFCRYADDSNIYVKSRRAGLRVYASIKDFLENRMKLKVNETKSAVALVSERVFLSYRIRTDGELTLPSMTLDRMKDKVRNISRRNRGVSLEVVIARLNAYLPGWLQYFKLCKSKTYYGDLDAWIRRKIRCYRMKQRKGGKSLAKFLMQLGIPEIEAKQMGSSGKGWWRLSRTPASHRAMDKAWFREVGLYLLEENWMKLVKL